MFSTHNYLKRKTPEQGINRPEYIEHLVEEYYTTTNIEAQEQVTANLANFAYDPINWNYLKSAEVLKLFFELLETSNEKLILHGSAGLCNICLDSQALKFIVKLENINKIKALLYKANNLQVILNLLTLLYQLLKQTERTKSNILCGTTLKQIQRLKVHYERDRRIFNISSLLLEEFGQRYEFVEINRQISAIDKMSKFTQKDLDDFSKLTGDFNYIHTEAVTQEKRKVHGALLNAIVAGVIGSKFPGGGSIVLEQSFSFPKPCRIEMDCEFLLKSEKQRKISIITYECKQNDEVVFKGQAKLLITNNNI